MVRTGSALTQNRAKTIAKVEIYPVVALTMGTELPQQHTTGYDIVFCLFATRS